MIKQSVLIFLFLLMGSSAVQAFTFKIATLSSDGSVWMEEMRAGAKDISDKTSKRVSFKFYPGGVMGGDKNVLRKIRFGQLHGAALPSAGLSDIYPDIQLYNLILKFQTLKEVDYVRKLMDAELIAGLRNKGLVSFGLAEMGLAYIMSTTPITSITELQKQKAWVPDRNKIAIHAFKAASVSPIPLPLRDVLMGLQTGMVDTVAGTPTGALALQWHTKIKYVTDLPLSYIFGVFVINEKAFNKISKQDQLVVTEVMERVAKKIDQQSRHNNINAIDALENQGISFVKVEPKAATDLKNMMEAANQKIVKDSGLSLDLVGRLDEHLKQYKSKLTESNDSK